MDFIIIRLFSKLQAITNLKYETHLTFKNCNSFFYDSLNCRQFDERRVQQNEAGVGGRVPCHLQEDGGHARNLSD